jgi:hypothetical protein
MKANRIFRVWQTYVGSKPATIETDLPLHAADCYAELNCLTRDTITFFVEQFGNDTKRFYNREIGSIFVTEVGVK